jgi:hypothetical protein
MIEVDQRLADGSLSSSIPLPSLPNFLSMQSQRKQAYLCNLAVASGYRGQVRLSIYYLKHNSNTHGLSILQLMLHLHDCTMLAALVGYR